MFNKDEFGSPARNSLPGDLEAQANRLRRFFIVKKALRTGISLAQLEMKSAITPSKGNAGGGQMGSPPISSFKQSAQMA